MDLTLFEVTLRRGSTDDAALKNGATATDDGESDVAESDVEEFDVEVTDEPPETESGRRTRLRRAALAGVAAALAVAAALLARRYLGDDDQEPSGVDLDSSGVERGAAAETESEGSGSRVPSRE